MNRSLDIALVHHPVRNREGEVVTSAITNIDVHDLARSARTYGARGYWVISPIDAQRLLVERILDHWRNGSGAKRVPERTKALAICAPSPSIDEVIAQITNREGRSPEVWVTAARAPSGKTLTSFAQGRAALERESDPPVLLLFGTAHGLHGTVLEQAQVVLAPIQPGSDFNHLSVRAAAAITLDRLRGDRPSS